LKDEVFYIRKGKLQVTFGYDEDIKKARNVILNPGDNFHVKTGLIHQMKALKDTEMFEFSTQHFDEDSYRVIKGD
jgi:mannose-6-phosphate isomerase-like protein (cupin superfamily)